MTHLEMDAAIMNGELDPKKVDSAVFIQCVGSREPEHPYCSKVCCTHSVETAPAYKGTNPTPGRMCSTATCAPLASASCSIRKPALRAFCSCATMWTTNPRWRRTATS
jgi:hypothetical protein